MYSIFGIRIPVLEADIKSKFLICISSSSTWVSDLLSEK